MDGRRSHQTRMYPQVFGKYVLERELARGGMARVVLATLRGAGGFEKKLVVKQIRDELASDDDFVRRFVEEAKTTVALAHPNIVPVYELGVELGTYFLAMEYVEGASLAELLRASTKTDGKPLSPEEGAYVGVEVCRALDYAHRRMNVVHRDVTPRNVMVDDEGQVKVIDFGIATPVATAPTGQGVFGSPGHMPPEQMDGTELTPAADVFAVAVLLMELWSGKAPFRRHTKEEIDAAMKGAHPRPSDADIRLLPLDDVMARAMALDANARPRQAEDLARALRKFLMGIDLGDVARRLGDRVRALREHPLPPATEKKPVLQRPPSRPTATAVGTQTFAAREEVLPTADGSSTRRVMSSKPAPAGVAGKEIETVATRPIETDPRDQKTGAAVSKKRSLAWIGVVGALGLAVGAFFVGKGAGVGPLAGPSVTATATVTAASASASTTAATTATIPGAATTATSATAPSTAPVIPAAERATITLLGDGTTVAVDGAGRGRSPARVGVEPGTHSVVFSFAATGESKGASVSVKPGERVTLRADFTRATPSIRIER
jgi:eukaryotic-like serine/threonine-protein kinase